MFFKEDEGKGGGNGHLYPFRIVNLADKDAFREDVGFVEDRFILRKIIELFNLHQSDFGKKQGMGQCKSEVILFDMGGIVGSGYHVNPKSLGYRTCTYVGIKLEKGSMYKSVVAELQKIPEIVECHFTTGPYTMLTKLYACDNEHLMDLLNNKMQEIPGVVATETLISLEQSIKKEIPIRVEK